MKDKFFHKEFNPNVTNKDDPKVKIINSLNQKEGDILEFLTRKSKKEIPNYNKY